MIDGVTVGGEELPQMLVEFPRDHKFVEFLRRILPNDPALATCIAR